MEFQKLALKQLDEQLKVWQKVKKQPKPKKGWINLLRKTLGLSSYQLATFMHVSQPRVVQIEKTEFDHTITLQTLEKVANAMGCKLVYGIVPKNSLQNILEEQGKKIVKARIKSVSHSMEIETQGITKKKQQLQSKQLLQQLLQGSPKKLWGKMNEI